MLVVGTIGDQGCSEKCYGRIQCLLVVICALYDRMGCEMKAFHLVILTDHEWELESVEQNEPPLVPPDGGICCL